MKKIEMMRATVESMKARSAWDKGVKEYMEELLDSYELAVDYEGEDATNTRLFKKMLLNGASDWSQYSWGGCSLIYNQDIAKRLCNNTELKRTANGTKKPNSREEWLDTQARALYQACEKLKRIFAEV